MGRPRRRQRAQLALDSGPVAGVGSQRPREAGGEANVTRTEYVAEEWDRVVLGSHVVTVGWGERR